MDVQHITRIRAAIVAVLEGSLGPVRVPVGTFERGVFPEMPLHKQQTGAKSERARHYFDVLFGTLDMHAGSPTPNTGSVAYETLAVEIQCFTHKRSTRTLDDRTATLDQVLADGYMAKQALKYPGALEYGPDGGLTYVVSGLMLGPGADGTPSQTRSVEDFENNLVRWSIVGAVILDVPQTAPQ